MDETLQRLLDTELRAEKIAKQAEMELDRVIKDAMAASKTDIERFEAGVSAIQIAFVGKAEVRAEQAIADMKRRYDERHVQVRELAERWGEDALDAAFAFLIDPASDLAKAGGR